MKNKKIVIIVAALMSVLCVFFIPLIYERISFQSVRTKILSNLNSKYNEKFSITHLTQEQMFIFKGNFKAQVKSTNNPDLVINVEYRPNTRDEYDRYTDDYQSQLASETMTKFNQEKFANILKY